MDDYSFDSLEDECDWEGDREPTDAELKAIERHAEKIMSCAEILEDIRKIGIHAARHKYDI